MKKLIFSLTICLLAGAYSASAQTGTAAPKTANVQKAQHVEQVSPNGATKATATTPSITDHKNCTMDVSKTSKSCKKSCTAGTAKASDQK